MLNSVETCSTSSSKYLVTSPSRDQNRLVRSPYSSELFSMSKVEKKNKEKGIIKNPQGKENQQKFPAGIRVLVVDDDETCLLWVENLLLTCNFKATTTLYAKEAIEMLRRNKDDFDLVITDVQMPEIDGFQLLETIGLEMDLPVIMMSVYSHQQYVHKGVQHGAVDYLVKPVRLEEIQNVWQHVLRKRKDLVKEKKEEYRVKLNQSCVNGVATDTAFNSGDISSSNKRCRDQQLTDDDGGDSDDDDNEAPKTKRPRVVWNAVLHRKFVAAVNHLGLDKAVPKRILELMDTDTALTRENIASHLQKYRMFLKKLESEQNNPEGLGARNSFDAINKSNSMPPEFDRRRSGFLRGQLNVGGGISSSELIQSGQSLRDSLCTRVKLQSNNGLPSFPNGMIKGFEQSPPFAGNTGLELSDYFMDPKMLMNDFSTGACQFPQTTNSLVTGDGGFTMGGMPGLSNAGFNGSWKPVATNLRGPFTQNQLLMNGNCSYANQQLPLGFSSLSAAAGESPNLRHNVSFPVNGIFESLNPIMASNNTNDIMESTTRNDQNGVHEHVTLRQDDFIPSTIQSMDDIMSSITARDNNVPSSIFMDDEFSFAADGPAPGL